MNYRQRRTKKTKTTYLDIIKEKKYLYSFDHSNTILLIITLYTRVKVIL